MTATRGSSATAATEARPRPVAAGRLRLNGGTVKLIPHHQDDKHGTREYRSPDGAWRVVQTRRPGGSRNARPRWEVHERCEGRGAGWRHHAAFERRRDALVFLDTTAAASGGESVTTAPAKAARDPRTLAGTTPVQPAPDAEGADHARPRRNPLPGHPVVVVRRAPVRSEADREGGRAGDLREVPAVPVGGQLPETPGSDEGGEEGDLTGRRVGPAADRKRGRTPAPPAPARRNGSSVVMTTETEFNISEEPLAERVLRQVRSGQLDESRLLPSAEKRARDVVKKLNRLAARQGWHTFMAGQAYAVATGKAPAKRNAEVMAVEQVMRWRSEVSRFAPDRCDYSNAWGDDCDDGWGSTAPVGTYAPHGFGLYDMAGNVSEWLEDCWHPNYEGAPDGSAWTPGGDCSRRLLRGGGWFFSPTENHRSATRDSNNSGPRLGSTGFRIARPFD